ncbi:MAG: hypothetical protein MI919_33540 [Holophagales bacterium]|nr:hypothetical protein [Holophagales bacterium]
MTGFGGQADEPSVAEASLATATDEKRVDKFQMAPRRDLPEALESWMASKSIEAMGVAERVTAGTLQKELALKVYVERKLPKSRCDHVIPGVLNLEGLPPIEIDVEEVGKIRPHGNKGRVRPAVPGFSIGRAVDKEVAGTFGLLVRKKGQDEPTYILSNSHAIADSGRAEKGDVIVQPGAYDGGTAPADAVGNLSEWIPFIFSATSFPNLVDCAIAQVDPGLATAAIAQLGVPTGVNTGVARGMRVKKMGRTSTLSYARVKDVHLRTPSVYPTADGQVGRVGFSDQIMVTFYSTGGDSGSSVLDEDDQVVGLHFAGSEMVGVSNKIANVTDALDIEVITEPRP